MSSKGLKGDPRSTKWTPSSLLEALSMSFDDLEAYAYINGGDVILRQEYELLILKIPSYLSRRDFAVYVNNLGGTAFICKNGLGFILPTVTGIMISFYSQVIHTEKNYKYMAIEPLGIVNRSDAIETCP